MALKHKLAEAERGCVTLRARAEKAEATVAQQAETIARLSERLDKIGFIALVGNNTPRTMSDALDQIAALAAVSEDAAQTKG